MSPQLQILGIDKLSVAERIALVQEIWDSNPLLRQYLGRIDNPEFILYRIRPARVRYMKEWALEYIIVPFELAEISAESSITG